MNTHEDFGIPSIAAIGRHPIHPMLVPLPIGFLFGSLLGDLAYWGSRDPFWATMSAWLVAAGFVSGAIAAATGLVDFLGSERIRALYHAWYHLVGNAGVLIIAVISLVLRTSMGTAAAVLPWGLMLSAIVVALLVFTGWHGGEMVFGHGVGMKPHEHNSHRVHSSR
jgi:uncharacterized membrane protein